MWKMLWKLTAEDYALARQIAVARMAAEHGDPKGRTEFTHHLGLAAVEIADELARAMGSQPDPPTPEIASRYRQGLAVLDAQTGWVRPSLAGAAVALGYHEYMGMETVQLILARDDELRPVAWLQMAEELQHIPRDKVRKDAAVDDRVVEVLRPTGITSATLYAISSVSRG
jgi:hypothetical protein